MSDTFQGPGWWLASDGKWYPPEQWTGPPTTVAPAAAATPYAAAYPAQCSGPAWGPSTVYPPYGVAPTRKTNGLAIASLVCSLAGLLLIPLVLGVVFGFVARSQIKSSHGTQGGEALALAGIIIGFGWAALFALGMIVDATTHTNTGAVGAFGVLG